MRSKNSHTDLDRAEREREPQTPNRVNLFSLDCRGAGMRRNEIRVAAKFEDVRLVRGDYPRKGIAAECAL